MRGTYYIEAPVEKVFEFFLDPRLLADLFPSAEIREVIKTSEGAGTYTSYRTKIFGVPFNVFSVYTDVVPNKHITEKSSSALVGTWEYTFEPHASGTTLIMEHHSRSIWNLPLVRNLGDLVAARLNETFVRRVSERIEAPAAEG